MKNFVINIIMLIMWLAFLGGMLIMIIPLSLVELAFWIVADTQVGWLFKKVWDSRKMLRFR